MRLSHGLLRGKPFYYLFGKYNISPIQRFISYFKGISLYNKSRDTFDLGRYLYKKETSFSPREIRICMRDIYLEKQKIYLYVRDWFKYFEFSLSIFDVKV